MAGSKHFPVVLWHPVMCSMSRNFGKKIPGHRWPRDSTDKMIRLTKSQRVHNAIIGFVDRLSKILRLVPTTSTITAPEYAHVFLEKVYNKHGMPPGIVSGCDPCFASDFFKKCCEILHQSTQDRSVAYQHETDSLSERMNQYVDNILRGLVNPEQSDWGLYYYHLLKFPSLHIRRISK